MFNCTQLLNSFLYIYFINCVTTKKLMKFAKKNFKKLFSKLYNTKKSYDMQLLDNNEKETFMIAGRYNYRGIEALCLNE